MLISLQIENYAIIRELKINFNDGFTAITGETGAGKSILLGALSLIFGNRADTSVLHDSTKKCIIEAGFSIEKMNIQSFFNDNDLDYQDITIIRREIIPSGKSRAFINDTPVNLNQLKSFTHLLIDIHSQHHQLLLSDSNFKLKLIDDYAQHESLLNEYRTDYNRYNQIRRELVQLRDANDRNMQERDYLHFLLEELENAKIESAEDEHLIQRIKLLSNAEKIKSNLYSASQMIGEGDDNILSAVKNVKQYCQNISQYDTDIEKFSDRLESLYIELKDIHYEINRKESDIVFNAEELEYSTTRLDRIYTLEQKHHVQNVEELLQRKQEIANQLNQFTDNQNNLIQLNKDLNTIEHQLEQKSHLISENRKKAALILEKKLKEKLAQLNMPDGILEIRIERSDTYLKNGVDTIDFFFSANKGVSPTLLEKAASGGELSRIILAIKSIITETSLLPTIIFDEIDTGISGIVAGKIGDLMQEIALNHQLIVITHLPQVAAKAQYQYRVYKEVIDNQTYTNLSILTESERVEEISLMISGNKNGESSRHTAKELLKKHKA